MTQVIVFLSDCFYLTLDVAGYFAVIGQEIAGKWLGGLLTFVAITTMVHHFIDKLKIPSI